MEKIPTGEEVFIHPSVVQGAEALIFCTDAWAQVVGGLAGAEGEHRVRKVWGKEAWQEEKDREKAVRLCLACERGSDADGRLGSSVRGGGLCSV